MRTQSLLSTIGLIIVAACGSSEAPAPVDASIDGAPADATHADSNDARRDADGDSSESSESSDSSDAPDVSTDASTFVGAPIALSSAESAPHAIVVDGSDVYWTNSGDGTVVTCKTDGSARAPLVTGRTKPWALGVDTTTVYFSDVGTGEIRRALRSGGADSLLTFAGDVRALVVDASSVFYTVHDDPRVDRTPKSGSVTIGYSFSGAHPMALATDGTNAYWTNDDVGSFGVVTGLPLATFGSGSPSAPLVSGLSHPAGIAVDGDFAYVVSTGDGRVLKIGKDGSAPTSATLSDVEAAPTGVVVDADAVYVTDDAAGTVIAFDKSTGARRVLANDQKNPDGIAVTSDALYWVNRGDGHVMKLAR